MSDKTLLIPPGALISDALRESGFALDYECGGRGVCVSDARGRRSFARRHV